MTWLWEDPDRCQQLVRAYNDKLNAIVLRSYDVDEAKHYPGMARVHEGRPLRLRPHQHAAVARMVAQPRCCWPTRSERERLSLR